MTHEPQLLLAVLPFPGIEPDTVRQEANRQRFLQSFRIFKMPGEPLLQVLAGNASPGGISRLRKRAVNDFHRSDENPFRQSVRIQIVFSCGCLSGGNISDFFRGINVNWSANGGFHRADFYGLDTSQDQLRPRLPDAQRNHVFIGRRTGHR